MTFAARGCLLAGMLATTGLLAGCEITRSLGGDLGGPFGTGDAGTGTGETSGTGTGTESSTGTNEPTTGTGSSSSCEVLANDTPCVQCSKEQCCAETVACSANEDCSCFLDCIQRGEPNMTCQDQCSAATETSALTTCLSRACADECR